MIAIQNLSKTYPNGKRALHQISLEIDKGVFGLLGPNGSGKTTLMRILVGLLKPSSGKVMILGQDISKPSAQQSLRKILGYLPQELGLHETLTVQQEIDYFAILKGFRDAKARAVQIDKALERVSLQCEHNHTVKSLSGGQKRRLGIAIALLGDPILIIVDEPTAGLDPAERVRFRNLLLDLGGERIVLLSTHIVEDVSQICNSLAVIKTGEVVFTGPVESLIARVEGYVWTTDDEKLARENSNSVISSRRTRTNVEYRLVGDISSPKAISVSPTLEDAYLFLMNGHLPD
jgi:ABC-type multidrug transport system ATPase subunit